MEVELSHSIRATPEEIYDRWLDPKRPGGPWFGVVKAIVNPVVDGLFYHCVHHEGRDWAHYGRFVTLDRGRRIEQTWVSDATKGRETLLTLTFAAHGSECLVTLRHVDLPDDEMFGVIATGGAICSRPWRRPSRTDAAPRVNATEPPRSPPPVARRSRRFQPHRR